jgi:predicted phage-related endonuclease
MNDFIYINHEDFQKDRHAGIGASDIPILAGASDWTTPYELWKEKRGNGQREISESLQALFEAGHYQEPIAIHKYLKEHDEKLADQVYTKYTKKENFQKTSPVQIFTRFYHKEHPFMFCHPDLIYNNKNIEVKFSRYSSDFDTHDLSEEGIPFKYYLQTQYQMLCTGLTESQLVLNFCGSDFYTYGPIEANEEVQEKLEKLAFDFWQLVINDEPPMPTTRSDVMDLFPDKKMLAKTIPEELEIITILQKDRYNVLKKRCSDAKKEMDRIKATVTSLMIDNNVLQTQDGDQICKISVSKSEKIKKLSEIKKDHADIYETLKGKKLIDETITERVYL